MYEAVKHAVSWGLEHRNLEGIEAIGIDEVQWHRGHHYQTVVYQLDQHNKRLLWIGPDRTAKTLLRFFRFLGRERSAALQFVCSDMWQAYLKVIAKKASQAVHVLDRFHIMQRMGKAINDVRAAEVKQLKQDGYEPVLKGARWLLLKRPENLTDKQAVKLQEILQYNLKSVRSHLMKEDFQRFWEYWSPTWAGKFLDQWCTRAMRSKIEPMKEMARTLRRHRTILLNWFRARGEISNGSVEGMNNKAKLAIKKAYGFAAQYVGVEPPEQVVELDGIEHLIAHEFHHTWMRARCEPPDARTDVYQLGILLYELTTRQLQIPHEGSPPAGKNTMHMQ